MYIQCTRSQTALRGPAPQLAVRMRIIMVRGPMRYGAVLCHYVANSSLLLRYINMPRVLHFHYTLNVSHYRNIWTEATQITPEGLKITSIGVLTYSPIYHFYRSQK